MAYPMNYQDAEHRRALSALMDDLQTPPDATGDEPMDSGASADIGATGTHAARTTPAEMGAQIESGCGAEAELQVRTTRLAGTGLTPSSAN